MYIEFGEASDINGLRRFRVKWFHDSGKCFQATSICLIKVFNSMTLRWDVRAKGNAVCGPKDQFCKRTGRKLSFHRAVNSITDLWVSKSEGRKWRSEMWAGYKRAMPGDFGIKKKEV